MDLQTYVKELPRGGVARLAEKLGISTIYLSQLIARQNNREPSPQLCVAIERETKKVRRWDLRNDWREIWPELERNKGAPKQINVKAKSAEEMTE